MNLTRFWRHLNFSLARAIKKSGAFRKYEDRLIKACDDKAISTDNLVEFIIAGEKLKLDKLLSSAITLASKCYSRSLKTMYDTMLSPKTLKIK